LRRLRWRGVDDRYRRSRRNTECDDFVCDAGFLRGRGIEKDRMLTELLNLSGRE
jgi:hypothetical protein